MTASLSFEQVTKNLAGRPVLREVSFACPAGSVTALLGPNGAGKTTSVALATGLRRPDAGRIRVLGCDVATAGSRLRVSLVPQEIGFPDAVTAGRCLDFVAAQRRPTGPGLAPGVLCERLGIGALLPRRAGGLSGGERRKLALALGLVWAPEVLILDEATTNLDESSRALTWALVQEYAAAGGAALVTSHILADIESHADRVVALHAGQVVLEGALGQIRATLGGSLVTIALPEPLHPAARAQVARAALGTEHPIAEGRLGWRTTEPFALVQALVEFTADVSELTVRAIPLATVLDSVIAPVPAAPVSEGSA